MRIEGLEEAYHECLANGKFIRMESIDEELAGSLFRQAEADWVETLEFEKVREAKTANYARLFSNRYDVMRMLIHAIVIFDKVKPGDHKCIAAHLCFRHPEFDLDWETLETMRILRNNIQYRGQGVGREIWISFKPKFEVYIKSLFSFVRDKVKG